MTNDLEESLRSLLQKKISFTINSKTIKDGQLILFNVRDYYITMVLCKKEKNKIYEIPVPFDVQALDDGDILFDYTLKQIYKNNLKTKQLITQIADNIKKTSKFYDLKVLIKHEKLATE